MTSRRVMKRKSFSIEEANATLPLVRAIVADWAELAHDVGDRQRRLSFLLDGRNPDEHDLYQEELVQVQKDLEKDTRRLLDYREELRSLGVEAENGEEGCVHFPTVLDGRKAHLCWRLGEGEVLYWHQSHAHCRKRHLLTADSIPGGIDEGSMEGH